MARSTLIRNGWVVTDRDERSADILIQDGKIRSVAERIEPSPNCSVYDADGLWVLPGGIDPHVHLSCPRSDPAEEVWVDDFVSGSKAALAGGITSVGCIAFPLQGETPAQTLHRERLSAATTTLADLFFHPVLMDPSPEAIRAVAELPALGCHSLKIFMSSPSFEPNVDQFEQAIQCAARAGITVMLHCEDYAVITTARATLAAEGHRDLSHYAASRPVESETAAVRQAISLGRVTGASIYIVHLSSREALELCIEAQKRHQTVYVETRPIYLHFSDSCYTRPDGPLFVGQPPLRSQSDIQFLWEHMPTQSIHTIASDHAPWTRQQKMNPELDIFNLRPGMENLQTMLPVLFSEGVVKGRISPSRFVELTSTSAAKIFGLYPRKGTIEPGSDADLVLWDPGQTYTISDHSLFSNAGFSVFNGYTGKGRVIRVFRRGHMVFDGTEICADSASGVILQTETT